MITRYRQLVAPPIPITVSQLIRQWGEKHAHDVLQYLSTHPHEQGYFRIGLQMYSLVLDYEIRSDL